jgi:YfiH family protein
MRSSEVVFHRTDGANWLSFPPLEAYPLVLHGFIAKSESPSSRAKATGAEGVLRKINPDKRKLVTLVQTHQDECVIITPEDIPKGRYQGDAVLTNRDDILISVSVADCLPIFLLEEKRRVVGLVHAGWRGTLLGIARRSMQCAEHQFKCHPSDFTALFGPCIHSCCYQVSRDVGVLFGKECTSVGEDGGMMFDLICANMKQLARCGVKEEKMLVVDRCTCCDQEQFSSYRREGKSTVKMIGFMGLRAE